MKFELLAGHHYHNEKKYKTGDIVESVSNLEEIFVLKFKRRKDLEEGPNPNTVPAKARVETSLSTKKEKPKEQAKESNPLGEDVTEEFKRAKKAGCLVFKSDKGYSIADPTNPKENLSLKILKDADSVNSYIRKNLL